MFYKKHKIEGNFNIYKALDGYN